MRFPIIHGMIKRRIFANFHLDPDTIPRILPDPFRNVPMIQLACRSVLCIGILIQAISVSANDAPSSRPTNMPRSVIASYNRESVASWRQTLAAGTGKVFGRGGSTWLGCNVSRNMGRTLHRNGASTRRTHGNARLAQLSISLANATANSLPGSRCIRCFWPILWGRMVAAGTQDARAFRYAEWTSFLRIGGSIGGNSAGCQGSME